MKQMDISMVFGDNKVQNPMEVVTYKIDALFFAIVLD